MKSITCIAVYTLMLVAFGYCETPCQQSMEIRNRDQIILKRGLCEQTINQTLLQDLPDIYYYDYLSVDNKYTLFLLENNKKFPTQSFFVHWVITDIIPTNYSLTANKTVILGYLPPAYDKSSNYTIQFFRHPPGYPSLYQFASINNLSRDNFIPSKWLESVGSSASMEDELVFHVAGKNVTIAPYPTTTILPVSNPVSTNITLPVFTTLPSQVDNPWPVVPVNITPAGKPNFLEYNITQNPTTFPPPHVHNHEPNNHTTPYPSGSNINIYNLSIVLLFPLISLVKTYF